MELIPGKRYQFTGEGVANADGDLIHESGAVVCRATSGAIEYVTFELLPDPLPTTPGSVIRWPDRDTGVRRTLVRVANGVPWLDATVSCLFRDDEVQGADVLFDAGAERD